MTKEMIIRRRVKREGEERRVMKEQEKEREREREKKKKKGGEVRGTAKLPKVIMIITPKHNMTRNDSTHEN